MTDVPLSRRIVAAAPVVPPDAQGIRWRAATAGDVDAILDAVREMDAADHPDFTTARDEVADEFARDHVDPERDTLLALDGDDRVLAYGSVSMPPEHEGTVAVYTIGGVRPTARGRGLGRALLAWQRARALELLAGVDEALPGWLETWVDDRAEATQHLLERAGYRVRRWFTTLVRPLDAPIEDTEIAGYEVRSPTAEDAEAVRVARNAAFRDHWGSQPRNPQDWALRWAGSTQRHDLASIAVDGDGAVAAFVLAEVNPEDTGPQGFSSVYLSLVGTVAAHRRRGLAAALISRTLRLAATEQLERAVLDVDADSPTGAVGLYDRLGFAGEHRTRAYVLEV